MEVETNGFVFPLCRACVCAAYHFRTASNHLQVVTNTSLSHILCGSGSHPVGVCIGLENMPFHMKGGSTNQCASSRVPNFNSKPIAKSRRLENGAVICWGRAIRGGAGVERESGVSPSMMLRRDGLGAPIDRLNDTASHPLSACSSISQPTQHAKRDKFGRLGMPHARWDESETNGAT